MINLVDDLLSVSRIDQGVYPNQHTASDIMDIIRSEVSHLEPMSQAKNLKLRVIEHGKHPCPKVQAEAKLLREVIQNIVSNAIKYSAPNEPVFITVSQHDQWVKVSVKDKGIVIAAEDRDRLFSK